MNLGRDEMQQTVLVLWNKFPEELAKMLEQFK
jgi:hypothetical protein